MSIYASPYPGIKSKEVDNDTKKAADRLINRPLSGTGYLAYRDLKQMIDRHVSGDKGLDYGCGAGFSSRLLKSFGFNVWGIDVSDHMLEAARRQNDGITYEKITNSTIPFPDKSFDVVLATLVLLDIPSLQMMKDALKEIARVLKENGVFLAVTISEVFPYNDWISAKPDTHDRKLTSGDNFKVYLPLSDITFNDYFYTKDDYISAIESANLKINIIHEPLGLKTDNIIWNNEIKLAPFTYFLAKKSSP